MQRECISQDVRCTTKVCAYHSGHGHTVQAHFALWHSRRTCSLVDADGGMNEAPILSDEELLAAVDAHKHADDIVHASAAGTAAGICIHGVWLPALCRCQGRLIGLCFIITVLTLCRVDIQSVYAYSQSVSWLVVSQPLFLWQEILPWYV